MNILLIDKEKKLLDLLETLILFSNNTPDLKIEKAQNHIEAKRLALYNSPDLVVIDPMFSGEWGLALIKTIKEIRPQTFIVALMDDVSTLAFDTYREQCLKVGVNRYFERGKDFMLIPRLVSELISVPSEGH